MSGHRLGPWRLSKTASDAVVADHSTGHDSDDAVSYYGGHLVAESIPEKFRSLIAAAPELLEALHEGRRAIGDHHAPNDCYATGPMTGNPLRDYVQCPACSFIAMHDAAIAKATGAKT